MPGGPPPRPRRRGDRRSHRPGSRSRFTSRIPRRPCRTGGSPGSGRIRRPETDGCHGPSIGSGSDLAGVRRPRGAKRGWAPGPPGSPGSPSVGPPPPSATTAGGEKGRHGSSDAHRVVDGVGDRRGSTGGGGPHRPPSPRRGPSGSMRLHDERLELRRVSRDVGNPVVQSEGRGAAPPAPGRRPCEELGLHERLSRSPCRRIPPSAPHQDRVSAPGRSRGEIQSFTTSTTPVSTIHCPTSPNGP